MWDLVERCGGQLRVVSTGRGVSVLGYDMTAVLAMAAALSVPQAAVAEFLPGIEAVMVRETNRELADRRGEG